jgi:triosephosphate isomerase
VVGVSLKMYFGGEETMRWCSQAGALAAAHPAVASGDVDVFVLPSYPMLVSVLAALSSTPVRVGAQDLYWADRGPFTGEVSGAMLAELGCRYVAVGHAERRRLFGEDDASVALKVEAALRNSLCPVVCVGEATQDAAALAASVCVEQLRAALARALSGDLRGPVVVAYEPHWAIGADKPADAAHIRVVATQLRKYLESEGLDSVGRVIYGGSAGTGLMAQLDGAVSGLFLGRRVHDPRALTAVIDEVVLHAQPAWARVAGVS